MRKLLPYIIGLILSTGLLAGPADDLLKKYPKGFQSLKGNERSQTWSQVVDLYKATGRSELLKIAYHSLPARDIQAAEGGIAFYDMFMARPLDFIKGSEKEFSKIDCIFPVLIPRTQYLPYVDIERKLKEITKTAQADKEKVQTFHLKADEYFKMIKSGKVIDLKLKCP